MCDCLNLSEKNISDFLIKENNLSNVKEFGYVNKVLTFSKDGGWKLVLPFEIVYSKTEGKKRSLKTSIFPAYCPFCGESQSDKQNQTDKQ